MIREEYLNLDFMYKFINTLCKRDSYVLTDFDFGMLTHNKIKDVSWVLQNGYGYNMVYKFKVCKIPKIELRGGWGGFLSDLKLNYQEFYFDLSSETIMDYEPDKTHFVKNPPFFNLNNQIYYGIYSQPKYLKYHYSKARDYLNSGDMGNYMKSMDIVVQNILSPHKHLDRKRSYCGDYDCPYSSRELEQIVYEYGTSQERLPWLHDRKKYSCLSIHEDGAPVFYTNNVLELTAPLADDICRLQKHMYEYVDYKLRPIYDSICLLGTAVEYLAELRLNDLRSLATVLEPLRWHARHDIFIMAEKPAYCIPWLNYARPQDAEEFYDSRKSGELFHIGVVKEICDKANESAVAVVELSPELSLESKNLYNQIKQNMQKLTPENMSIDSLVNISRLLNKKITYSSQEQR